MTTLITSFAQGTHASKPAAASTNTGRYYYETDTNLLYQSTGAAWTLIAINTAFVASGSSHAAGLVPDPGSTAGSTRYLREDATWDVPAGGGSITSTSAALSADVTIVNANTWYDGPSLSLAAGTWLLVGAVLIYSTSVGNQITAQIWDGTTSYASGGALCDSTGGLPVSIPVSALVAPTVTTTYKLSCAATAGSSANVMKAAAAYNAAGNTATYLNALKIA